MEKEAKKEAFRKYLESNGVLDILTKVLVALYEENDKPSSPIDNISCNDDLSKIDQLSLFIQQKLGGPTISEFEKLQGEKEDLQIKYDKLFASHSDTCKKLEELKGSLQKDDEQG